MPRPKKTDRPVYHRISLPQSVSQRLNEKIKDPVTGKPQVGKRSQIIEKLVRQWLREQEGEG